MCLSVFSLASPVKLPYESAMQENKRTTHFGFQTVDWDEKASRVKGVFDGVASRYDVMNDAMSFGAHRLWKRHFIKQLPLRNGVRMLDQAGGTGDIAFGYQRRAHKENCKVHITISDINTQMLEQGRLRAVDENMLDVQWMTADAQQLPLPDASLDLITMAFGIRNVTDIPAALAEMYRTLDVGGQVFILEFSKVSMPLQPFYDAYSFHLIPKMGEVIANDHDSYQYLVESIRQFPDQKRFANMLKDAGFSSVRYENLMGGVVAIHHGVKR